jgi:hypothetical protein
VGVTGAGGDDFDRYPNSFMKPKVMTAVAIAVREIIPT